MNIDIRQTLMLCGSGILAIIGSIGVQVIKCYRAKRFWEKFDTHYCGNCRYGYVIDKLNDEPCSDCGLLLESMWESEE